MTIRILGSFQRGLVDARDKSARVVQKSVDRLSTNNKVACSLL